MGTALIPAEDPAEYFEAPAGRVLTRSRFFCSSPDGELFSLFAWGQLGPSDTDELLDVLQASLRRPDRVQLVVLDAVQRVSPLSMARFARYFVTHPGYLRSVQREAVVRPEGVVGMLAEGFYPVVPVPYDGAVVRSLGEALRWLGVAPPTEWLDAALAHRAARQARPEILPRAEAQLRRLGAQTTVEALARALSLSPRTLQRRLREAGTTFERLRTETLVQEAERRLIEGQDDIKRIALELGYRSPARLTEAFSRARGTTPAAFRARAQADLSG